MPRSKSLSGSGIVNVGVKSRPTSAGDLHRLRVAPGTESLRNSRNAALLVPPRSASTVIPRSEGYGAQVRGPASICLQFAVL
jgi:hypothetical protein